MKLITPKQKLEKIGFNSKTLSLMTESEISTLFKNFILESKKESKEATQITKTVLDKTNPSDVKTANYCLQNPQDAKCKNVEMKEGGKKNSKKNPWAICTSVLGKEFGTSERSEWSKKQMNKYEKCVMGVKEGKSPSEHLLEEEFRFIIEKNLRPEISKKEILNMLFENSDTEVAPAKPKTKPGIRPSILPNEEDLPDPRMGGDTEVAPAKPKTKPGVRPSILPNEEDLPDPRMGGDTEVAPAKPKTKPGVRPSILPNEEDLPDPRMGKSDVPKFLKYSEFLKWKK
jgi:hypothetical protein